MTTGKLSVAGHIADHSCPTEKKTAARDLGRLLEAKTLTSYGASHITEARASELLKYATRLVDHMESVLAS